MSRLISPSNPFSELITLYPHRSCTEKEYLFHFQLLTANLVLRYMVGLLICLFSRDFRLQLQKKLIYRRNMFGADLAGFRIRRADSSLWRRECPAKYPGGP